MKSSDCGERLVGSTFLLGPSVRLWPESHCTRFPWQSHRAIPAVDNGQFLIARSLRWFDCHRKKWRKLSGHAQTREVCGHMRYESGALYKQINDKFKQKSKDVLKVASIPETFWSSSRHGSLSLFKWLLQRSMSLSKDNSLGMKSLFFVALVFFLLKDEVTKAEFFVVAPQ